MEKTALHVMFGRRIEVSDYTPEQREIWIDEDCPTYTGIMAAINGIAFRRYRCFIDELSNRMREVCYEEAAGIGMAWFKMPDEMPEKKRSEEVGNVAFIA